MNIVLYIVGVLALLSSLGTCAMSKSAIHETLGVTLLIVSALAIGFAAILDELHRIRGEVTKQFYFLAEFLKERIK